MEAEQETPASPNDRTAAAQEAARAASRVLATRGMLPPDISVEQAENEILYRLWNTYGGSELPEDKFHRLAIAIGRNYLIEAARRKQAHRSVALDSLAGSDAEPAAPPSVQPLTTQAGDTLREQLTQAMSSMPESDRRLIELHLLQGLSWKDVAIKSGLSYMIAYRRGRAAMEGVRRAIALAAEANEDLSRWLAERGYLP